VLELWQVITPTRFGHGDARAAQSMARQGFVIMSGFQGA
jgi:hypothetical protein